ncbi:LPS export ABC transporter permease LptG [Mesorhizobium sp. BAC0120]|uniref:LPS export ABC transporter permease LptG n=1 Tax=Mesorhizobium sp. BAC0120 TaxID=3090670 RepID=UPI00298D439A|nr:LPS export ABC transporter permease LptG [Mesorhizobium sp. BAC0120]MDW6021277.1 LPS export ABC transporter permease LptG [Mesorhizobium sp. BAC0120]
MIGRTLFAYFFRRYVATFVQFFIGLCLIAYLVDFTEMSRFKSTLPNYTVGAGLLVSALHVPLIAQTAIPFIVLFAAIATLMALNRRYELVVARSAGVSAWQFLAPLCLGSFLVGVVAVTIFNPVGAHALTWAQQLEASFSGDEGNNVDARAPWIRQRDQDGVTIIGAKSTAKRGLQLNQVTFLQIDDSGDIIQRIDARQANLAEGKWVVDGATLQRSGDAPERVGQTEIKTNLKPEYVEQKLARPETIPFFELPAKMRAAWSFGLNANGFGMQFHSLIALPMLLVAMTLIAATVSMRFARMGQSATMILGGVLAGFLLYVVSVLVKAFGTAGIVPPVVAAWIPVVVAMFFGVTFLLYREDG